MIVIMITMMMLMMMIYCESYDDHDINDHDQENGPLYAFLGDLYLMHRDEGLDHDDNGQHYNDGDTNLPVVEYFYFDLQTLVAADRVLKEVPVEKIVQLMRMMGIIVNIIVTKVR